MKHKFIYFDLNELQDNRGIVINPITFKEIIDTYGQAVDGMDLHLWTDDSNNQDKYDPMVYPGKFIFDSDKKSWFIEINPSDIEHHSTSKTYSGYSLEEVMGESYLKRKKNLTLNGFKLNNMRDTTKKLLFIIDEYINHRFE